MKNRQERLAPYIQALPNILQYQLFTKLLIGLWLFLMGRLFRLLPNSTGRVAVSSGDFTFLFGRWQGILLLLGMLISLYVYVALDLNAKIILSKDLLTGNRVSVRLIVRKALPTIKSFICIRGLGVILYMRAQIQSIIIMEGVLLAQRQHFHVIVCVPCLKEVLVPDRDEGIHIVKAVRDDLTEGLDGEGTAI